jgi:hypothetical protein
MRGYFVLLTALAIVLGSPDRALALLIVSHDEWALSNRGFANAPDFAEAFALNIASLFAPDGSGDFLVHSQSFGLVEATLETTIADAGHTWTVDTPDLRSLIRELVQWNRWDRVEHPDRESPSALRWYYRAVYSGRTQRGGSRSRGPLARGDRLLGRR